MPSRFQLLFSMPELEVFSAQVAMGEAGAGRGAPSVGFTPVAIHDEGHGDGGSRRSGSRLGGRTGTMAPCQWQRGALASLWALCLAARPGLAAPPAATTPSPQLLAAHWVLERLMAAGSIEAPISLVVRPFHGAPCPPPAADPVARREAASATPKAPSASVCLSGFELPPRLRQGFFVPFVVSLQRQADPDSDPERPSAAIDERTILLNTTGLALVRQVSPAGKRQQAEPAPVLPPEATCRIAQEFAAIQLGQPGQRRESFARIHTLLAQRIHKVEGQSPGSPTFLETLAFSALTMGQIDRFGGGILGYVFSIPGRNQGQWINARLSESPHWQALQLHAPQVATALKELRKLPEGNAQCNLLKYPSCPSTLSDVWKQIDGWFGVAAQERDEVIEEQQQQAQVEALRLLAAAGFDPRSCADVFVQASAAEPDPAVLEAYEQARRKGLDPRPGLPSRFLPAEQKVVIYPRSPRPGNGGSGAGSDAGPNGSNRQDR